MIWWFGDLYKDQMHCTRNQRMKTHRIELAISLQHFGMLLYPASRGYISSVWAVVQKVTSVPTTVQFVIVHARNSSRDKTVVKWREFRGNKNGSRTGKNPFFYFVSGGRGYFSHARSHSEIVASARRVMLWRAPRGGLRISKGRGCSSEILN